MESVEAGRVLMPVTMQVGVGDSRHNCELKISPKILLFWCLVTAGGCDELAAVGRVERCKMASLGVGGLVYTRVTSFVGPMALGEGVSGEFLLKLGEIPMF